MQIGYDPHLRLRVREGRVGPRPRTFGIAPSVGTIPAAPTSLSATAVSASAIDVTWVDNSWNEDGFRIERAPVPGGPWVEIDTVGPNVTIYNDGGLSPSTQYCYRVRAFNAAGNSAYTNVDCATTFAVPVVGGGETSPIWLHVPWHGKVLGGYRLGTWWQPFDPDQKE